jgi:iron-regulated transporter 1
MRPQHLCLLALAVLAAACSAGTTESGEYDYGYGDSDLDYLDDYGYYGSDEDAYYEEYGTYADDTYNFGYDDYGDYLDYGMAGSGACTTGKDGKVQLANGTASCDLKLQGLDQAADLVSSGIDGVYKLSGCHSGRPTYKRKGDKPGGDRVLWYSQGFADWDISNGTTPNDNDILVYGTDVQQHTVPLFVQSWNLGADLTTKKPNGTSDESYVPAKLSVTCADGQKVEPPKVAPAQQKVGPMLTDEEIEAKYRMIYERFGKRPEPNPTMNFSFVTMLVLVGLTVVLAIPYMLVKRSRAAGPGYQPVATSFSQVIQQSKKKHSGHIH